MSNGLIGPEAGEGGIWSPLADGELRERGLAEVVAQSVPELIYVKDAAGRYVFNNASHLRFLGARGPDEVRGRTVLEVMPLEVAEKFDRDDRAVLGTGRALVNEVEPAVDAAGRRVWMATTKVPLRDGRGVAIGLVGISRDITERRRMEEELRRAHAEMRAEQAELRRAHAALEAEQAELRAALGRLNAANEELAATQLRLAEVAKLHTVGAMAAGIAHEVKNPLAMIGVGVDYLARRLGAGGGDERVSTALTAMRRAVDHARRIVQGLLDFSRPGRLDRSPMPVGVPIERAMLLMHGEVLRRRVRARAEVADGLPPVSVDCAKVEQVLINVIGNALQAMPNGGILRVGAAVGAWSRDGDDGGDGVAWGELPDGERAVVVTVEDTGPGIPPERLKTVFEPFSTTKPAGEGTGLGLSVARDIMGLHGGGIAIKNRPEGGVRVTLGFKPEEVAHGHDVSTGDGG